MVCGCFLQLERGKTELPFPPRLKYSVEAFVADEASI